jgi:hypothetical protein
MRSIAIFIVAAGALAFASNQAFARLVSISGTHGKSEIRSACGKAGGVYSEDPGGYGCTTNCSGGQCTVGCKNNGKCNGSVPGRTQPSHTLNGILRAPSAGVKATGGNASPKGQHRSPAVHGVKTKAAHQHSTGPTNPNSPGGGTGPFAPPNHRRTSGGTSNPKPMLHSASDHQSGSSHWEDGKH